MEQEKSSSSSGRHIDTGHTSCPHWAPLTGTCLLVKDGLFLPVEQHIITYCQTSHYRNCRHFQQLAGEENHSGLSPIPEDNRRRSIRVPGRHAFRFSEITGSDQLPGIREDDAWTIDLSEHGLRFATRQTLAPQTPIRFLIQFNRILPPAEGSGRVVWSEPIENTQLFHAGIAFDDPSFPTLIANYL